MSDGLPSAVEVDRIADVDDARVSTERKGYALRKNRFCGVLVAPRKSVKHRARGPIWPNSDAHGIANEGASK